LLRFFSIFERRRVRKNIHYKKVMIKKLFFTGAVVFMLASAAKAQPGFIQVDSVPVKISGNFLDNPWAGGMNFCLFSPIDLNLDGIKDLFVFDKSGNRITTYLNTGTASTVDYHYAPEYIRHFPPLHDWAMLVDYNCDGKEDIYSYSDVAGGFKVYKNTSTATTLQFTLVTPLLYSDYQPGTFNLYVSSVDLPALVDMDDDGDIDILTFQLLGTFVEYHKNLSMELYGTCDSLKYQVRNRCWGYFSEHPNDNNVSLDDSCSSNVPNAEKLAGNGRERHSGSSLLSFDTNNDGAKELLLGDISFRNMVMLFNDGTATNNHISATDTFYPSYDTPVDIGIFPAGSFMDVNNDGAKDLIAAPYAENASENITGIWYYENLNTTTAPDLNLAETGFMQNQMIEVGEGAYPALFDYDNDGLLDLFVGNYHYHHPTGPNESKISLYRNIGTPNAPSYDLITRDYEGLSSLNLLGLVPAFGDLDGDSDMDMIVGEYSGKLHYFENIASTGNPASFVLSQANLMSATPSM
jgi:hypothetical protein